MCFYIIVEQGMPCLKSTKHNKTTKKYNRKTNIMDHKNENKINGNQNIVIQDIKESTLTLNVNGDVQDIRNDLAALKEILEKFRVQTFRSGNNIYNIRQVNKANFGFVTGEKKFNQLLTSQLIQEIEPYSKNAKKFLSHVIDIPDWESNKQVSNKAKEIIAYSFVGVIGIQIRRLMAIGEEGFSEKKQQSYIENCIVTTKGTLELVCFSLLSKLWDEQQENYKPLNSGHKKIISHFFDKLVEGDILQTFILLKTLVEVYEQNKIK